MSELNQRIAELRGEVGHGWTALAVTGQGQKETYWPHYTTDWAACGPLLEDLLVATSCGPLQVGTTGPNDEYVYVDLPNPEPDTEHYFEGETLLIAVCAAWLAWKGSQK